MLVLTLLRLNDPTTAPVRSSPATGVVHTLRGRWTDRVVVKDRRTGTERVLFAAPPQNNPSAVAAVVTDLELRPLPRSLEAAAYEAAPAAVAVAAAIAAATGAEAPTLASHEVWSRLTDALHTHDWHAARDAKHAVEEAQRVRSCGADRTHLCFDRTGLFAGSTQGARERTSRMGPALLRGA